MLNRLHYASATCVAAACATFGVGTAELQATWSDCLITTINVLRRPVTHILIDDAPEIIVRDSAQLQRVFARWRYQRVWVWYGKSKSLI